MDVSLISNQVEQKFGDACTRIYGEFADTTARSLQEYFEDFTAKACSLLQNGFANVVIASQSAFEQCCREAIEDSVRSMRAEFTASLRRSMDAASESLVSKFQEESVAEVKELETAKQLMQTDLSATTSCKVEKEEVEDSGIVFPSASLDAGPSASLFEEALKSFNAADFAAFTKQAELMAAGDLLSPPPSVSLPPLSMPPPLPPPPPPPAAPSGLLRPPPTSRRYHSCSFCGLKFPLRSQLRRHLRSHVKPPAPPQDASPAPHASSAADTASPPAASAALTSPERPFACDLCGRAFNKRWNLTAHLRIHTDERPFVCEACGKAFRRKSCLVIHRRSHSRERPFACGVCGKSFADGSSRNKHQRLHLWLDQPLLLDGAGESL